MIRPTTPSNPSQLSTPPRSTTFPAKSAHKHHIPHHPHRVHHHRHRHHDHDHPHHDKSVPQSAILPPTSSPFGDFLSKTSSRIDGNQTPPRGQEQQQGHERANELKEAERERETWKEVEHLKAKRGAADEELRRRLTKLSTLSTTTTRRLDYTYYSLLSSISSLASAVSALSSLSAQISDLQTHFASSSASLTSEITTQISSSTGSCEAQARRISRLETRIKEGRGKVGRLGERLDGVRAKVEGSSLRDRESRRIMGRRLKMLWGLLGSLVGLFLILAATRQWRRNEDVMKGATVQSGNWTEEIFKDVMGGREEEPEQKREKQRGDQSWRPGADTTIKVEDTATRRSAVDADATLRLLDEL